jgi:hypothetical protein
MISSQVATYEAIRNAFMEKVKAWGASGEIGLLIVYWSGHGFLDDNRNHRLDCADSSPEDRRALHLRSLLLAMLGPPFPSLQAAFVDACAIDIRQMDSPWKIPEDGFQVNSIDPIYRQFVLYSQRPGLYAPSHRSDDPNSFYSTLLRELDKDPAAWPPDLPVIASRVLAFFETQRSGSPFGQWPVFYSVDWDWCEKADAAIYARPDEAHRLGAYSGVVPGFETRRDELAAVLGKLGVLADERSRRVLHRGLPGSLTKGLEPADGQRFLTRLAANVLADPIDLGLLLESLDQFPALRDDPALENQVFPALDRVNRLAVLWSEVARLRRLFTAPGADGDTWAVERALGDWINARIRFRNDYSLSVELAERVAASAVHGVGSLLLRVAALTKAPPAPPPVLDLAHQVAAMAGEPHRASLQAWVDEVAGRLNVRVSTPPPERQPVVESVRLRLMVAVEPLLYDADRYEVRTWRDWGGGVSDTPPENKLRVEGIADLINKKVNDTPGPKEVELFLPINLLAEGVGSWRVQVGPRIRTPIDARLPVKLRSWDRVYNRDTKAGFDELVVEEWKAVWRKLPGPMEVLGAKHCVTHDGVALPDAYLDPPPVCIAASLARETLHDLLLVGVPIALWPIPGDGGREGPSSVHDRLIKELVIDRRPDEIPGLVYVHRKKGDADPDPLRHLCLLWDDPGRLPPGHDEACVSLGYT